MPDLEEATGTPGEEAGQGEVIDSEHETPDYAGFSDPSELAEEYQRVQRQVQELESLKGRQGNELGELRSETARLQGMLEALESERARATAQPAFSPVSAQDLQRMVDEGEITLGEAALKIKEMAEAGYDERVKSALNEFKTNLDMESYRRQYIKDNPGYTKAFEEGHLQADLKAGFSGEQAYDRYLSRQKDTEIETLKKQLEEKVKAAETAGVEKGISLEKGKEGAASVIGSQSSGLQASAGDNVIPMTSQERREKALETLRQMRQGNP